MNEPTQKVPPEDLQIRAKPRRAVQLNRKAVAVLAVGAGAIALTVGFLGAGGRSKAPAVSADSPPAPPNSRPEGITTLPEDYGAWRPIPQLGPPAGELGRPVLHAEQQGGIDSFKPDPEVDAQRVARLRLQDEAEAAVKSNVLVQLRSAHASAKRREGTSNASRTEAENFEKIGIAANNANSTESNDQVRKGEFLTTHPRSDDDAGRQVKEPSFPYQLMAGTIIPAALVTGINSDLPGQTIASVTENVYDTVSGRFLLIPQGSRLIGQYDSQVSFGQRRVLLVWTRLVMPNGDSISLGHLSAADLSGNAGLEDRVDYHWDRVFAGAAVSTLLGINAQLADTDRNGNSRTLIVASRQSAQDSINEVGQQLTRRNLNIQPTLSIRPGFPLRVLINKDFILKQYASDPRDKKPPDPG